MTDKFLISDTVQQTWTYSNAGDQEMAFNFASLVVWRVDQNKLWLSESEDMFISLCLAFKPPSKRKQK